MSHVVQAAPQTCYVAEAVLQLLILLSLLPQANFTKITCVHHHPWLSASCKTKLPISQ